MTPKQLKRKLKKRRPKAWAAIEKEWDYKMIGPVLDFVFSIEGHINPKVKKALRKGDYLFDGVAIETSVWKLLAKVRRITQQERK